jgi:hypothetical protein
MTGACGTFEFQLGEGIVVFHLTGNEPDAGPTDKASNPWDKVLKNGKAKPALTVLKKVP